MKTKSVLIGLAALCFAPFLGAGPALAQGSRLLAIGDPAYELIERLQRRGHLLELPATARPYSEAAISSSLARVDTTELRAHESRWFRQLRRRVPVPIETKPGDGVYHVGHEWTTGAALTNGRRLDPLRPLDADTSTLYVGSVSIYPNASLRLWMARGPFVAQAGLQFDGAYNDDPDGLDVVKRIWVRNDDAYVGANLPGLSAYIGRYRTAWAPPGADGLLVSENPRAFDRLSYAFGGGKFTVRGEAGELDSATEDGRFTGRTGDSGLGDGAIDRFVVSHRFDWQPSPKLMLSVQESALYSGPNAGWSPLFIVPSMIQFFGIDNTPKNLENNGFAAGQLWGQYGPVTIQGQLMLDDFDVLNGSEPTSYSLSGTFSVANVAPAADLTGGLTVVSARAYNTDQRPGVYVYALRGLATAFNDFAHVRVGSDVYLDSFLAGLRFTPQLQALWQGEASFLDAPLAMEEPTILVGTPERTIRASAVVAWAPSPWFWLSADLGVNRTSSVDHVPGVERTRFVGLLDFGGRIRFGGPARLER